MYVDDNDETWPLAYDSAVGGHPNCEWWYAVGGGRNGSTTECEEYFLCPTYGSARLKGSTRPGSYGWNIYGTGTLTGPQHYGLGYRMSDMRTGLSGCHKNATIDEPTNTIAIGDSREADYGGNGIYIIGHSSMTYMPTCHRDGGNFGFCDGHVEWFSARSIYRSDLWNVDK
jgi:prepilin-type processing-associated H-X9-DG protein